MVCMDEEVGVKNDVAAGGELLKMMVRAEEKESLFSIVGGPAPLMNLQEKSSTSKFILYLIDTDHYGKNVAKRCLYDALKCLHDILIAIDFSYISNIKIN